MLRWKLKYIHFHLGSMGWHWPAVIPARVRTAYWQANADGWTEFESVSAGCAGSRPVALRASSPRLAQLNGIKNQRMVRGQCAGWCRPGSHELVNSKPQETFGPILGAPPAPAHTSHAQSINTLPIWTVSFSNHISPTWPGPQQMRRSANNSWAQRNDEMKTIVCTLWGRWGRWSVV